MSPVLNRSCTGHGPHGFPLWRATFLLDLGEEKGSHRWVDMGRCVPPCPTLRYPLVLFTGDSHRRINAGIQQFNPRYNSRDLLAHPVNLVCHGVSPTRDRRPLRVAATPLDTASAESACSTHHCIESKPMPSDSLSAQPALHLPHSSHKSTPPRPQIPIALPSFFRAFLP